MNIAYIGFPQYENDCKWANHFAETNKIIFLNTPLKSGSYTFLSSSIKVYEILPNTFPFSDISAKRKALRAIQAILEKEQIDIIHSLYAVPNAFWAFELGFTNHIVTTRGSDILIDYNKTFKNPQTLKERIIYRYLRKKLENSLNAARFITSTSTKQIQIMKTFIHDPSKIHLVRTGVDCEKFSSNLPPYSKHLQDPFIIFSPRTIAPLYHIELILDGVLLFKKKHPDLLIELWLIDYFPGTEYTKLIKQKVAKSELTAVSKFLPVQTEAQMISLYMKSDIVVSVPLSDGTPNSVLEAMLTKKPAIISNLEYDADLFNEDTIWKLTEDTPEVLAENLNDVYLMDRTALQKKLDLAYGTVLQKANLTLEREKIQSLYEQMLLK